jgi:hypothetical protein
VRLEAVLAVLRRLADRRPLSPRLAGAGLWHRQSPSADEVRQELYRREELARSVLARVDRLEPWGGWEAPA